jgi:hypothetical protein
VHEKVPRAGKKLTLPQGELESMLMARKASLVAPSARGQSGDVALEHSYSSPEKVAGTPLKWVFMPLHPGTKLQN